MKYIKKNKAEYTQDDVMTLMHDFNVSALTANLLLSRNLKNKSDIENFINIDQIDIIPGINMPNAPEAVARIESAMTSGEKIAVYGDYDVDGICGVSIVINAFKEIGYDEIFYYIPNRIKEGYGLNTSAIDYFKEENCTLIITVDCGISNAIEIDYANTKGIDVIVTDHHTPPELLPNAINVNPKLSDNEDTHTYCGAVVALKLMCALIDEELFFDYCDLAAIATIADMVDLLGENRKIVKYGLQRINKQKNKNIKFLVDECVKNQKTIRVDDIAYFVAPAINASGRVDQADKCVELFTNNTEMPQETASILSNDNLNRRMIEKSTMQQVSSMIEDIDLSSIRGIILYKENWHPGVLGIVASKIKNKYFRPVILLTKNNDILVGSARSIEGVNMHDAIKYCKQYVSRFGGHFMAAGLSLNENDLNMFKRKFEEYLMNYDIELFFPKVLYDIDAKTEDLNDKFLQELELFEPFGKGNPSPTFLLEDVLIDNYKKMGNDNQHFRCKLDNSSNPISSVAFSNTMSISNLQKYRTIVSINKNEWNGRTSLQAQIKDIKPSIHKDVGNKDLEHAYDLSLSQGLYGSLDTVFEEIVIDQIKEKIQSSIFGKLLLVLDKDAEKKCLSLFDNEIDILDVRFETIEKEKINTNTILFAPDIQENDFSKYGEIYLLSSYDIKGCYKLLHDYNNVYIINNHNRGLNSKFTLDLKKLREIFVIIKSEIKSNKIDSFINGTKQYEKWEIRIALQIFSEVGLIKVQKRKPRYILTDIKKVKVENSITYITIQEGK